MEGISRDLNVRIVPISVWRTEKCTVKQMGSAVAQLVEALRYKPEGRGFDSQLCLWNSGPTMALGSTQPLTEMSTGNISCGVKAAGA